MYESWPVVARGHWLYDRTQPRVIEIVRADVRFGSGDHEDEPGVRDDLPIETFYVVHRDSDGLFLAGGGGFATAIAAKQQMEQLLGPSVRWE